MADIVDAATRSRMMSGIRSKDTKPEIKFRKHLFRAGYRFRKNDKRYPGKPDIVLPKYNTIIFIHGCFWHCHKGCKDFVIPKTRTAWWLAKLEGNKVKDKETIRALQKDGWNVIVLWECKLKKNFNRELDKVLRRLGRTYADK